MRAKVKGLLARIPIRKPYFYLELPRRNFFIGFSWKTEGYTRPVTRGGVMQRVETTEYCRRFRFRLSVVISLVFACTIPPRRKPSGDPSRSDWPNIQRGRERFFFVYTGKKKSTILDRLQERGFVKIR